VDRCPLCQIRVARDDGDIAVDGRPVTEIEVASNDGRVACDGMTRIDRDGSHKYRNIASDLATDVDRAEGTGDITDGLPLRDCDLRTDGYAVVIAFREGRECESGQQAGG